MEYGQPGQYGPGGGSLPELIMRTGTIFPFDPMHARQDISVDHVNMETRVPVAYPQGVASYGPPPMRPAPFPLTPGPYPAPGPTAGYFGYADLGDTVMEMGYPAYGSEDFKTSVLTTIGALVLGAIAGVSLSKKGGRALGAGVGALVGAGTGTLASMLALKMSDRTAARAVAAVPVLAKK